MNHNEMLSEDEMFEYSEQVPHESTESQISSTQGLECTVSFKARGSKSQAEMELCDICEDYIPGEDEYTCNKCGSIGCLNYLGLDEPVMGFACRRCVEQGKIGTSKLSSESGQQMKGFWNDPNVLKQDVDIAKHCKKSEDQQWTQNNLQQILDLKNGNGPPPAQEARCYRHD
jgi:hypothetical protein